MKSIIKLEPKLKRSDKMEFEEEKTKFLNCGQKLVSFNYDVEIREVLDFILQIETDLFRARMKAERTINYRRF